MSDKSSKFCSHCGSVVEVNDTFCSNCGASLAETIELDSTIPLQQPITQTPTTSHVTDEKPYVKTRIGYARASLILGAIAFVMANLLFVRPICLPLCVVSILFAVIGLNKEKKKPGFAIGGIILSALAFASYMLAFFIDFWWYIY